MSKENSDENKKRLLTALGNAEEAAKKMTSKGQDVVKQGQYVQDLAKVNEEFVRKIPDDSYIPKDTWDDQINYWKDLENRTHAVSASMTQVNTVYFGTNTTAISSSSMITNTVIKHLPVDVQATVQPIHTKFQFMQSNLVNELYFEFERLGLNLNQTGTESAAALVRQADNALKSPSSAMTSPNAVLIPLREAINRSIADLLRRRPNQERAQGIHNKITSICKQCDATGLQPADIYALTKEADKLMDLLSDAKQATMERDNIRDLFYRGLGLLRSFLRAVDEGKLK